MLGVPIPSASAYGQNGERSMFLATEDINAAGFYSKYKTLDMVSIGCHTPGWDQKVSTDHDKEEV